MPSVYNWQIGRAMQYPHAARYPRSQFAFVFNINRCIACQTCTMACKSTWTFSQGQEYMWWNNVETKPYGGYPHHWDVKLLSLLEAANPGGQVWNAAARGSPPSEGGDGGGRDRAAGQGTAARSDRAPDDPGERPYGTFEGKTIFEVPNPPSPQPSPRGGGRGQGAGGAAIANRVLGYMPTDREWSAPNFYEDTAVGPRGQPEQYHPEGTSLPEHRTWFFYLARICNHCTYPACLAACPRNAIYKRDEDGIVLVDQERCRGYRKCVEACPYKKVMYRGTTRVAEKCIACYPRIEGLDPRAGGRPMETRCMTACVGQIRLQGLVQMNEDGSWAEDRRNPLYYLIKVAQVALPLYPQFGTLPNGYYIPPRWVPRPYLRQMFGPGVDHAIERYTVPDRELLAVLQLFRRSQFIIFRYEIEEGPLVYETEIRGRPFQLYNDTVIAFGRDGEELFRTTVEEPIHVRPPQYVNAL